MATQKSAALESIEVGIIKSSAVDALVSRNVNPSTAEYIVNRHIERMAKAAAAKPKVAAPKPKVAECKPKVAAKPVAKPAVVAKKPAAAPAKVASVPDAATVRRNQLITKLASAVKTARAAK